MIGKRHWSGTFGQSFALPWKPKQSVAHLQPIHQEEGTKSRIPTSNMYKGSQNQNQLKVQFQ
jgi:hypothetical protein